MNILVACPMITERSNFLTTLRKYPDTKHSYKVIECGVGKVASAIEVFNAIISNEYDLIAVVGYAASSKVYKQGDIVMPAYAQYSDANVPDIAGLEFLTKQYPLIGEDCPIYTSDSFVDASLSFKIRKKFSASACLFDMESTAIAQVASDFNIPVGVCKMVSDIPEQQFDNVQSFNEFVSTHSDFLPMLIYFESL